MNFQVQILQGVRNRVKDFFSLLRRCGILLYSSRKSVFSMASSTGTKQIKPRGGRYFIEAVGKAVDVLWAFQGHSDGLMVEDLISITNMTRSSVYRLLCTMVEARMLELDATNNRYFLGPRLFQLAASAEPSIKRAAEPLMHRLWTNLQETLNLGVMVDGDILFLSRIVSPHPFRLEVSIGSRSPIHCTALGKAIAAYMPWKQVENMLQARKMPRMTPKTITTVERFADEMEKIRRLGYAMDDEEAVEGGRCVAAPITNAQGKVVAALSVSGPINRMTTARVQRLVGELVATCAEISARLGNTSAL